MQKIKHFLGFCVDHNEHTDLSDVAIPVFGILLLLGILRFFITKVVSLKTMEKCLNT